MKKLLLTFLLLALPMFASSQTVNKCLDCHETIGDKVADLFKQDVHSEKGITCAGCHGGDDRAEEMEQAMAKDKGFIGVPKGDDISQACAKCHSSAPKMVKEFNSILPRNQLEILTGSVHGKLSTNGKEH
ncbi:MAG: ammonia-forming cytochrome c nitrite reductase subunit c552, partial [Ignavibacteriales bacterium]|nr:ammonia-forming cytochrome c nitrite reductase subunit c552 [Ignavibacteriales bacterium]